jgi:hypothetical protein
MLGLRFLTATTIKGGGYPPEFYAFIAFFTGFAEEMMPFERPNLMKILRPGSTRQGSLQAPSSAFKRLQPIEIALSSSLSPCRWSLRWQFPGPTSLE